MSRKVSLFAFLALSAMPAFAQSTHHGHSNDMQHGQGMQGQMQHTHTMPGQMGSDMHARMHDTTQGHTPPSSALTEPGQGAFAALAEIVRLLEARPDTDWSKVDLAALRAHLQDMDRVVMDAVVSETSLPNGISATATGDADTIASLQRMVPAHAAQLARDTRWTVTASETPDGAALHVTSEDPAVAARIKGLGFFGLMASQDHHRAHHLLIATGQEPHAH